VDGADRNSERFRDLSIGQAVQVGERYETPLVGVQLPEAALKRVPVNCRRQFVPVICVVTLAAVTEEQFLRSGVFAAPATWIDLELMDAANEPRSHGILPCRIADRLAARGCPVAWQLALRRNVVVWRDSH
jgi:hypothetical protein